MTFIRDDVAAWLAGVAAVEDDPVLADMHREARERGFPIVGPQVGRFLHQIALLSGARRIFELGSGFGYSTLWFARALPPGGEIVHTDGDPGNTDAARRYLERAGVADRVRFRTGDARAILDETPGDFDVIFLDIDKHQYPDAWERIRTRVRIGGVVIADNLIWSGRVAAGETDPDTEGIREYVRRVWNDGDFLSSLLPVRDGVGVTLRIR